MKKIIITIIFLLLVTEITYLWLQNHPVTNGEGPYSESPDKIFMAEAWNKNDQIIFGNTKKYYELRIYKSSHPNETLKRIVIEPKKDEKMFDMRSDQEIIKWSDDSSEVEFSFEGMNLKFKVDP